MSRPVLKKLLRRAALVFALLLVLFLGRPVAYLAYVWSNDLKSPLPDPAAGQGDFSHLERANPLQVISIAADPLEAEQQLAGVIARASRQHLKISISGAKHSMGGHTLYPGGISIDMLPFNHMAFDGPSRLLDVGAGARWSEVIPFLDKHGYAMAVMQSNNDFSVGGSLSVNCHGWQPDSPPIADSVESFRLVLADGSIRKCSRTENADLFSLALGGYGLFGVILDARLHVVPNEFYRAVAWRIPPANYANAYFQKIEGDSTCGLAFGRLCIAPSHFLNDGLLVSLRRVPEASSVSNTLKPVSPRFLERLLFRGSVGSDYGKDLCWDLETWEGGAPLGVNSRNQIMDTPSDWFASHDPKSTEILHEYFVPRDQLASFVARIKPILIEDHPDLLNITVRSVKADHDTKLAYARQDMFGLVMFFHELLGPREDERMAAFTGKMIDAAIACGGTYYLPYRPHATLDQFEKAYPQARSFFAAKQKYDPNGIFQNEFYLRYGAPLVSPGVPKSN